LTDQSAGVMNRSAIASLWRDLAFISQSYQAKTSA
jgi:hypothetical protein